MFKVFKSGAHFLATFFQKVLKVADDAQKLKAPIEAITASIPVYGPLALTIEDAGFAALGELGHVIISGDAAAKQHLTDAGLDAQVIATVQAIVAKYPSISSVVKIATINSATAGKTIADVASAVQPIT
jgi:hypothetical protein